jgi:hypothetical protein
MQVPPKWAGQDKRFAESLKENLDVLSGSRGDPLDRAVTIRDLLESGIVTLSAGANFYSGSSQDIIRNAIQYPNLGVPPAPTSLAANGAFQNILLTWDMEFYTGHAYYEIFRHTSDVVASATLAGTQSGFTGIYSDPVGGGSTYYYWVRAVNLNGVVGPFNSSTGTLGQTQIDIPFMLNLLSNQITSSELAVSLSTPISQITQISTDIADINTDIVDINTDLATLTNNQNTINLSIADMATNASVTTALGNYTTTTSLTANYYTLNDVDLAISGAINTFNANTISPNYTTTANLNQYYYTKTTADSAIASAINTFNANTIGANYTTTADLNQYYYTKTTADSAIASAINTFNTNTIGANYTTTANLQSLYYTKTDADGAFATASDILEAEVANPDGSTNQVTLAQAMTAQAGVNGDLSGQYSVKIDANGHIAGFGLSNTLVNGTPTSAFIIRADKFAIIDPNSTADGLGTVTPNSATVPFVYTAYQAPSAANGQVAVPAGVYMDTAFIKSGSITTAQIGTATIDTANITGTLSANKIVGGKISTSLLNIDSSSITSQVINGTPTLVLGDVNVNKLTGNSISANIMSATTVYADKLTGDVNTLLPFRTFASQQYGGSETTMIEVDLPASSHSLGHKPFAICTGYIQPRFERVYRIKMYMKTAVAVVSSLGQPSSAVFNLGSTKYLQFSGDISNVVSAGQTLKNYMAVKTGTVIGVSVGSNVTTVYYSGNVFSTSDTITTTTSTNYVVVGESRTKAATATKLSFSVSGSKASPDTGIVGLKITITQYDSQDFNTDSYTSGIYINEVSGMIMGVR